MLDLSLLHLKPIHLYQVDPSTFRRHKVLIFNKTTEKIYNYLRNDCVFRQLILDSRHIA